MKILICGDWHGNEGWAKICFIEAQKRECEQIIQLGDCGFVWSKDKTRTLFQLYEKYGIPMAFLPGNHENWELLDQYEHKKVADRGKFTDVLLNDGPLGGVLLYPGVEYLGRARRFELGGLKFASLGGAVSIDKARRVAFQSWWPQETVTAESVESLGYEKVDIILSHDAPINDTLEPVLAGDNGWHLTATLEGESYDSRVLITRAVNNLKPLALVHGHYHYPYRGTCSWGDGTGQTYITGLHCDGHMESIAVLDTELFGDI